MSFQRHLPQNVMAKAFLFITVMTALTAAAQSNRAVQTLMFEVCQINKAGFSFLPFERLPGDIRGRSQRSIAAGGEPVATMSLKWISTSAGNKVSFQTAGNSRILIFGRTSSNGLQEFAVENAMEAEVTLSAIGKSGSIDLEICRAPAQKGDTPEKELSKIVYTLTGS